MIFREDAFLSTVCKGYGYKADETAEVTGVARLDCANGPARTLTATNVGLFEEGQPEGLPGVPAFTPIDQLVKDGPYLYAKARGIGVCVSTDCGKTWSEPSPDSKNTVIRDPLYDLAPAPPAGHRAAADAPPSPLLAAPTSGGVMRSLDAGKTWTPATFTPSSFTLVFQFTSSGSNVYAATDKGVYRSLDAGATWSSIRNDMPTGGLTTALAASGDTLFAGTNAGQSTPAVLSKSTDGGATWSPSGTGITADYFRGILIRPGEVLAGTDGGLYVSTDGGATWTPRNDGLTGTWISSLLAAGGRVYAGTQANASGVFASTDTGATWRGGDAVMNNQAVWGLASSGAAVLAAAAGQVGHPGSLYRSTDGGATWNAANGGLPANPTPWAVGSSGGSLVASVSANASDAALFRSTDAGITWSASDSGLPRTAGGQKVHPTAFASGAAGLYTAVDGRLYVSANDGATWGALGKPAGSAVGAIAAAGNALFASDYDVFMGLGSGLYRSLDGGTAWSAVGPSEKAAQAPVSLAAAGSTVFAGYLTGGLYRSTDGGTAWTYLASPVARRPVTALAVSGDALLIGTGGGGVFTAPAAPRATRLIPIVLDVRAGSAYFTTELALANRGAARAALTFRYTASLGTKEGSGSVTDELPAGRQLVIPDVIAYLRGKGLAIPSAEAGQQGGTLLVTFDGVATPDLVSATARTTTATASPAGSAGLAYRGLAPEEGEALRQTIFGLRANAQDRSNVAVFATTGLPVTVRLTAVSGSGDGQRVVIADDLVLPPYGWAQFSFGATGLANGWVVVDRKAGPGRFSSYGVVNDQVTNDGSFLFPQSGAWLESRFDVPVLVEAGSFRSELVLANASPSPVVFQLGYTESLAPASGAGGTVNMTVPAGEQRILPDAVAFLRAQGAAIGAPGGGYAGALHVEVSGALAGDVYAGARTAAEAGGGGRFGLFTPGVYPGGEARDAAFLYGLRSDAANRANVAVLHVGAPGAGPVTLELQAYDGDAGGAPAGSPAQVTLAPGGWHQELNFLAGKGVRNGWVKAARTSGSAPWIAYGVVNDGGAPGERTGDGAYVAMEVTPTPR